MGVFRDSNYIGYYQGFAPEKSVYNKQMQYRLNQFTLKTNFKVLMKGRMGANFLCNIGDFFQVQNVKS